MPQHTAPLSVIDQKMPAFHTSMWLVFPSNDPDAVLRTLQNGLDVTLHQLPFLSGEVFENNGDRDRTWINWSDDGPRIEWEEVALPELPSYSELAVKHMPLHDLPFNFRPASMMPSTSGRLRALIVSYTKIEGGLFVLVAPHHHVMDGAGREMLFHLWASNCCTLSEATDERRQCFIANDEPLQRSHKVRGLLDGARLLGDSQMTAITDSHTPIASSSEVATASPAPASRKFWRFSVQKLNALRRSIQSSTPTQICSINALLTALLWQLISEIRLARLRRTQPQTASTIVSELIMAVNPRKAFETQGLLRKNAWIGNLAIHLTPRPVLSFSDVSSAQSGPELDMPGPEHRTSPDAAVGTFVSSIVPEIIDDISSKLASTTPAHVAKYVQGIETSTTSPAEQTKFSYRSLRNMSALVSGVNLIVTAWSNFSFYPSFGVAGRPEYLRLAGQGALDGVVIFMPRKRAGDGWTAEECDAFEVLVMLREDDLKELTAKEVLQKLSIPD